MNILLTLAFNGTNYHGFQVQQNAVTVCAVIQDALQAVLGARPNVKGCSRTDAGVHARRFALSVRCSTTIPMEKLPLALNNQLPPDVRVLAARQVPDSFHARYSATGKEYEYVMLNSPVDDPFAPGLYYRVPQPINEAAMHRAGQVLAGRHDFAAFMAAGSSVKDTVRTITALSVRREKARVVLAVAADGFLYNMVRIITGTLLEVGLGRMDEKQPARILQSGQRSQAGPTLPGKGLFLNRVFYPEEATNL